MNDELSRLIKFIDAGGMSRRGFLTRSAAFGAAAAGASLLPKAVMAQDTPKQGGVLKPTFPKWPAA